jgi:hypothetical protein
MAMEGFLGQGDPPASTLRKRAFLKLHYMREHPILLLWSSVYEFSGESFHPSYANSIDLGKIQSKGQSAGNHKISSYAFNGHRSLSILGSSETTREAIITPLLCKGVDDKFK